MTFPFWFTALVNAGGLLGLVAFGLIIADKLSKMVYGPRGPQGSTGSTSSVYTPEERITTLELDNARHLKLTEQLDKQIGSCLKMINDCIAAQRESNAANGRILGMINDVKNMVMTVAKMIAAPSSGIPVLDEAARIQQLVKSANDKPLDPVLAAHARAVARANIDADRDRAAMLGDFSDIEAKIKSVGAQVKQKVAEVEAEHSCAKDDGKGCKACAAGKKRFRTVGKTFAEALTDGGS